MAADHIPREKSNSYVTEDIVFTINSTCSVWERGLGRQQQLSVHEPSCRRSIPNEASILRRGGKYTEYIRILSMPM